MRSRAALAALALLGCTAPPRQIALADLPSEVVWLAAITLDSEGQFSEGSGILRRGNDATLAAFAHHEGLVVVGWSEADLAKAEAAASRGRAGSGPGSAWAPPGPRPCPRPPGADEPRSRPAAW